MNWKNILKRYEVSPMIYKARKPTTKKAGKEIQRPYGMATVIHVEKLDAAIELFNQWVRDASAARLDKIGITGEGNKGGGKDTLYEYVENHVTNAVQRPKQGDRDGALTVLKEITTIIKTKILYDKDEKELLDSLIAELKLVEDSDANPKSIPFTVPEIRGEQIIYPDEPNTFGHYRTKDYVEARKLKGNEGEIAAVHDSWYGGSPEGTQTPPFWQVLFNRSGGGIIKEGLLPILEKIRKALERLKVSIYEIKSIGLNMRKEIEKVDSFKDRILKLLKNPISYQAYRMSNPKERPYKRVTINVNSVVRAITQEVFPIKSEAEENYIKAVVHEEDLDVDILAFKIIHISPRVTRTILSDLVRNLDNFIGPYAKGVILSARDPYASPQTARRELAFQKEIDKKNKKKKRIKKSWDEVIWRW